MAESAPASSKPYTNEELLADRQAFWKFFTGLTMKATIGVAILVILMAIFLV